MPAQALYLKWRPMTLDDVVGQEHVTATLRNALKQGKVRHAYLFSGPRGTGKTSVARLLAKAVNCLNPEAAQRPDNVCAHCIGVNQGRFLDLIEIDAASHTGVDDVRDLRDKIAFSPSQGAYKVYIIDEVHRFSGAAFDALLKTLEEPPPHALFVLATTEIDKVPATIKSRCQRFDFRRIPNALIVERLAHMCAAEGLKVDRRALELVARQSTGSLRDAISLLDQLVVDPEGEVTLAMAEGVLGASGSQIASEIAQAVLEQNTAAGLEAINRAINAGADPRQLARETVDWLRNLMLVTVGGPDMVDVSDAVAQALTAQAATADHELLLRAIRAFNEAAQNTSSGWQPQLPVELALISCTLRAPARPAPSPVETQPAPAPPAPPAPPPDQAVASQPAPPLEAEAAATVTLADIRQRWDQLVQQARTYNATLPALLPNFRPVRLDGNTLVLGTSQFFQDKFGDEDRRVALLNALADLFGARLDIRVTVSDAEPLDGARSANEPDIDDPLLKTAMELGGRIVSSEARLFADEHPGAPEGRADWNDR